MEETSVDDWSGEQDSWQFGDAWDPLWDDNSTWIGAIDDFSWPAYAWVDDSWWTSGWNEDPWECEQAPTSQPQALQQATSSDTSNQAPVPPTTSADKVSAVTVREPPGLSLPTSRAKASPKPKASTASCLLL